MKTTLTLIAIASIATGAFAQMGHGISKNAKHVIACPVTGDKVDMDAAKKSKMYTDYKGNRYFFCCADCPKIFKKNPAKYAGKPHIKTPAAHKH
jgi:YHS domain-containing protein